MKIAVLSSYIHIAHYGTELEIIQKHLDNGDDVTQLYCNGEWQSCTANIEKNTKRCEHCINQRKNGLKLIKKDKQNIKLENLSLYANKPLYDAYHEFENIEELKKFEIDNFDVGMATASTLISYFSNPYFSVKENKGLINKIIGTSINIYYACKSFFKNHKFDIVYIFNGRFAVERAVLRACEASNIEFITHERGCDQYHYLLFRNTLPHDINYWHNEMLKAWDLDNNKYENAKMYFETRYKGVNKDWFSYTNNQKKNLLPKSWDNQKHKIVIFNSSENELAAIGKEWEHPLFGSQLKAIEFIANVFRKKNYKEKYQVYLRMHPNLLNAPEELKYLLNVFAKYEDVIEIISPESPIDSYSLLLSADKIITFASTMGIEATYWGRASILLGKSFYYNLDVAYKPESIDEAEKLILEENLKPKNKRDTLIYGNYLYTCGEKYVFYEPENLFNGRFKGKRVFSENIKSLYWHSFKQRIKKTLNLVMGKNRFEIYE
jgi:hypothetical protein